MIRRRPSSTHTDTLFPYPTLFRSIQAITEHWIDKHFTGVFSQIHFGNPYSTSGVVRSKAEICKDIGACMLVDDSVRYAQNCQQQDIPVILFGNYAWNAGNHGSLQRAHSWSEAVQMIFAYSPDHCFLSVTDHDFHLKRRGMSPKLAQKARALLGDADGIKFRATGYAIPSLLQIIEDLQQAAAQKCWTSRRARNKGRDRKSTRLNSSH